LLSSYTFNSARGTREKDYNFYFRNTRIKALTAAAGNLLKCGCCTCCCCNNLL